MINDIKYSRNHAQVICDAFDRIPIVKDGKGDAAAMVSFMSDIKQFRKFKNAFNFSEDKSECMKYISEWNEYINLREAEDYIPHFESKNKLLYLSMF